MYLLYTHRQIDFSLTFSKSQVGVTEYVYALVVSLYYPLNLARVRSSEGENREIEVNENIGRLHGGF